MYNYKSFVRLLLHDLVVEASQAHMLMKAKIIASPIWCQINLLIIPIWLRTLMLLLVQRMQSAARIKW